MPPERWILTRPGSRCTARAIDGVIAAVIAIQHGVFAAWQLPDVSHRAIQSRLGAGLLRRVHIGVYAVGELTWKGRLMAAVLACGPGAYLSHRSAAALHNMLRWNGIIEVTVPKVRRRPGIRAHRNVLREDEVTEVDGIPVTTAARTLIDIAPYYDLEEIEGVMQQMEIQKLWDETGVQELIARHPGRRGMATLRTAAPDEDVLRSKLERSFRRFVRAEDLGKPKYNATIVLDGDFQEVDALWLPQKVVVELDSRQFHLNREAFEEDRRRDRKLRLAGYDPYRVTDRMLKRERAELAEDLRRAIRTAGPTWAGRPKSS